jgi:protein-tyrosine kinase
MSLMQRAMEKAEREGRLRSWTPDHRDDVRRDGAGNVFRRDAEPRLLPVTLDDLADVDAEPAGPLSPLVVSATAPESAAAEQFRLLRSRVEARASSTRTQLILVTSPRLGEGKTTTSANLAVCLAQDAQHRVLLIEADLRRSRIAALFGVRSEPGLIDVLIGSASVEEALVRIPGQPLTILPAGLAHGRAVDSLASSLVRLLDGLKSRFSRIIVDTAPLAVADTHELARIADGILLVARAGVTPRPALARALDSLDRDKVIGFVLNDVDEVTDRYSSHAESPSPHA